MAGSKKKRKGTPRPNNGGHKPQGKLTKSLDKAIHKYCTDNNKSYEDVIKKGSGYCYKDMLPRHLRNKDSTTTQAVSNSMRSIRNKANENNTTKMNNNKNNTAKGTQNKKQTKQTIPNNTKVSKIFNDPKNNNKPRPYSGVVKSFDEERKLYTVKLKMVIFRSLLQRKCVLSLLNQRERVVVIINNHQQQQQERSAKQRHHKSNLPLLLLHPLLPLHELQRDQKLPQQTMGVLLIQLPNGQHVIVLD